MFVFRKIWQALSSWNTRFEIRPFALLPTKCFSYDESIGRNDGSTTYINFSQPASNYMFKVNNRNTRKRCKICSKLIMMTLERRHWRSEWHSKFKILLSQLLKDWSVPSLMCINVNLTQARPKFPFFTPWKYQKSVDLSFSKKPFIVKLPPGGKEREHWEYFNCIY